MFRFLDRTGFMLTGSPLSKGMRSDGLDLFPKQFTSPIFSLTIVFMYFLHSHLHISWPYTFYSLKLALQ